MRGEIRKDDHDPCSLSIRCPQHPSRDRTLFLRIRADGQLRDDQRLIELDVRSERSLCASAESGVLSDLSTLRTRDRVDWPEPQALSAGNRASARAAAQNKPRDLARTLE